jgi:hypothetical protein
MLAAFAAHVNADGPIDGAGNRAATEAQKRAFVTTTMTSM